MDATKRSAILVGVAIAALACSFFLGRSSVSAPAPTITTAVDKTKSGEKEAAKKTSDDTHVKEQDRAATANVVTVVKTRWLKHPDGTVEASQETSTAKATSSTSEATSSDVKHAAEVNEKIRWLQHENMVIKESAKTKWSFGLGVGGTLSLQPKYEIEAGHRIGSSNFWLTGHMEANGKDLSGLAGLVTLRWEH